MYGIDQDQAVHAALAALRNQLKGNANRKREKEIIWSRDWRALEHAVESAIRRWIPGADSDSESVSASASAE